MVEELPHRKGSGDRRFKCRCLKVDEDSKKMCGNFTVKKTGDLTRATKFRACKACTEVYMRVIRNRWNRGVSF